MPTESWSVTEPQTIDIEAVSSLRAGIIAGRLDVIAHDGEGARVEVAEVSGEPLVVTLTEGRLEVRHREDGAQGWFKSMLGTISGGTQNTAIVSIALPARVPVEIGTVTGDGLTLAFDLSHSPFTRRAATLLEEEFHGAALDASVWTKTDPASVVSVISTRCSSVRRSCSASKKR